LLATYLALWWGPHTAAFLRGKPTVVAVYKSHVARPATAAAQEAEDDVDGMLAEGQEVRLVGPPAMAGKTGVIVGPAPGDAYAVRLPSGSIFNIQTENIKVLETTSAHVIPARVKAVRNQLLNRFRIGAEQNPLTRVKRVWSQMLRAAALPQAKRVWQQLLDKLGTGAQNKVLKRVQRGWSQVFRTSATPTTEQQVANAASTPASTEPATKAAALIAEERGEDSFTQGQEVLLTAPPAMAGKAGTIEGPVADDMYAVRMTSGRIFNVKADSMKPATASGGGGGGRGFGGSGRGRGGDGQPPGGAGSSPEAGDPGKANGKGWEKLPAVLILCAVAGILLHQIAAMLKSEPALPARVDKRFVPTAGSSSVGPAAAAVLLAAVAFVLLSRVLAWLQDHFSSEDVLENSDTANATAPLLAPEHESVEGTWLTAWHAVRAGLALGAPLLVVAWIYCMKKSRARAARVRSKATAAPQHVPLACDEAAPEATPEVIPFQLVTKLPPLEEEEAEGAGGPVASSSQAAVYEIGTPGRQVSPLFDGSVAKVHFEVELDAEPGDRLIVVGGDARLGAWDPDKTYVELLTDHEHYPVWSGTWCTNDSPALHEYKLVVVKEKSGETVWEEVANRRVYVLPQEVTVKLVFNSTSQELSMST